MSSNKKDTDSAELAIFKFDEELRLEAAKQTQQPQTDTVTTLRRKAKGVRYKCAIGQVKCIMRESSCEGSQVFDVTASEASVDWNMRHKICQLERVVIQQLPKSSP
jgi:hypothetical protein